jgi:phosphorylase kinase alpha/beta subunit
VTGGQETVFDKPMTPAEIQQVLYSTVQPYNVIAAVMQQEIILYCGRLIATNPELFSGILTIRVGWVLEAMNEYLKLETTVPPGSSSREMDDHSPSELRQLLHKILSVKEWGTKER